MTGREALLQAFDRLFDRAAKKLNVECSAEERELAKKQFEDRFAALLDSLRQVTVSGRAKGRHNIVPSQAGFTQDMGGRVTRYPTRSSEKTDPSRTRHKLRAGCRKSRCARGSTDLIFRVIR